MPESPGNHHSRRPRRLAPPALALLALLATLALPARAPAAEIRFNRDIRPILSDKCFQCHGPDAAAREADLRLDLREDALEVLAPGDPSASEVLARVLHKDPKERMPPRKIHKPATAEEINTLRQWIAAGAEYEPHWSYSPIAHPAPPAVRDESCQANPIDRFILARLDSENLEPSPPADSRTLARRLSLDLTGLPPTPKEVDDFLSANARDPRAALDGLVDRLLASSSYGEHLAWQWLDAARYADSDGYESDPIRTMWPWRDWVVESFNANMPYDRFITEQLAGDLLPDPNLRQRLATGFNRNHRLNNEGGITPEEWIIEYICDRAETTATLFLGLTWQCSRCHDHKFDPITQQDYYSLFAFFNNIEEKGSVSGKSAPPYLDVPALDNIEEYAALTEDIAPFQKQLDAIAATPAFKEAHEAWLKEIESADKAEAEAASKKDGASESGEGEEAEAPENIRKKLPGALGKTTSAKWTPGQKTAARDHFLQAMYVPADLRQKVLPLNQRLAALRRTGSRVMIMDELAEPRAAHILERGAWDQPRAEVVALTPAFLPAMDDSLPRNRLGLAQWLVNEDNPLTARVAVNRIWERFFGIGLVKTQEDFGLQGEAPSHPELLDWLARRFLESGWDLKALQKLIVTSQTYRQSSSAPRALINRDPENRLLARGPRYRLAAAVIRDQALAAGGLLVEKIGGPPVKPYQPEGLWREIIKGRVEYKPDTGDSLYRRSLYTLWRRAVNPPLMSLLDANMRDTCTVSQDRTNTPLQALLLLNDVTFVEAARGLAARMIREGGDSPESRATHGMLLTTGRPPTPDELEILTAELASQAKRFASDPESAASLITIGDSKPDPSIDQVELAAHTALARVLLNLDETLTKQ